MSKKAQDIGELSQKVAVQLQSACRGIRARSNTLIKRWERANIAAYKIQTEYRRWKLFQFIRKKGQKETRSSLSNDDCWAKVLTNQASFSDKMHVWRNVIELRRGRPNLSTKICLKAMFQSHGNLVKASILLANQDFVFTAASTDSIQQGYKDALNPCLVKGDALQTPNRRAHRHLRDSLVTIASSKSLADFRGVIWKSYLPSSNVPNKNRSLA